MKTETLTPELLDKKPEASHKKELSLRTTKKTNTLTPELLHKMNAYWRAANYLSVGQIYLYDNPLLKAAAEIVTRQAAGSRTLGHNAGPELHLRASQPGYQEV